MAVFQEPVIRPVSDDDPATVSARRISARLAGQFDAPPDAGARSTTPTRGSKPPC